MKYLFLFLSLACTANSDIQSKKLIIADHLSDCVGVGPQTCMLVKESPEDDWTYFYDQIEGFEYVPGYTYELIVTEIKVENPAADASSIKYQLKELLSKVATDQNSELMKEWKVLKLKGLEQISSAPTLLFHEVDNRLSGFAGCNNYFSTYAISGVEIKFDKTGSTRKLCPDMSAEDTFLKILPEVARFEVVKKELYLYDKNDEVLIIAMSI
ncbi:DUF4377 domain-containing protein [Lutimonas halocynthiae]|uniref:DUF4377 domain-containing protein n=1 Tax=Lutimonas halocynthiae TaxID=1446477 RepID=UPI0025B361A8|nr:DUF4377 domain-containing protein [Lutimonas halocynthiae]MDN3641635.1 DUF4377 domain-containing protein [Lutimonas halocynthiae]